MDGTGTNCLRVCERRRDIIIAILAYSSSAAGSKNDLLGSSSSSRRGLQHHFKAYGKQELGGAAEVSERTKGRGGHLRTFSATFTTGVATGESLASAASGGCRGIKSHTNGRCVRVGQVLNACANNISAHWSWTYFGHSGMITHFV